MLRCRGGRGEETSCRHITCPVQHSSRQIAAPSIRRGPPRFIYSHHHVAAVLEETLPPQTLTMSPTQTMTVEGASAIELETIRPPLPQRNYGLDRRASTVSAPAHPPTSNGEEVTTSAKNVKLQLLSCCVCFLVAGLNDGSLGTLLPYLLSTYTISTSFVGIMYATSFAGWFLAAIAMPYVVASAGAKGALLAGAVLYVVSQILRVWVRPSLSLLVCTLLTMHALAADSTICLVCLHILSFVSCPGIPRCAGQHIRLGDQNVALVARVRDRPLVTVLQLNPRIAASSTPAMRLGSSSHLCLPIPSHSSQAAGRCTTPSHLASA
jgi:hypothetical protein